MMDRHIVLGEIQKRLEHFRVTAVRCRHPAGAEKIGSRPFPRARARGYTSPIPGGDSFLRAPPACALLGLKFQQLSRPFRAPLGGWHLTQGVAPLCPGLVCSGLSGQ
jgi:hypothetical protein